MQYLDDTDFIGFDLHFTKLCRNQECPLLWNCRQNKVKSFFNDFYSYLVCGHQTLMLSRKGSS
jgi:hypothetical protein